METTVVNIMDIERYQFAGVIGKDKKSIPWTDIITRVGKYLDFDSSSELYCFLLVVSL